MATVIRAKISDKNKYHISKHRHYELKHFCLQYPEWKKEYVKLSETYISAATINQTIQTTDISDPTADKAVEKTYYLERIKMVEQAAYEADHDLYNYILKAVTNEYAYPYLQTVLEIPCSKDTYYDRYRKFFWILDKLRK